jgi:hypothetical protein
MNRHNPTTYISLILILFLLAAPIGTVAQREDPPPLADLDALDAEPWLQPLADDATLQQVIVLPDADASLLSEFPDLNVGDSTNLRLGYNATVPLGAQRILLRFDLAGEIPAGVFIQQARLFLYMHESVPPDDDPMPHRLQRIESPWAENTVTWNTEPDWGPAYANTTIDSEVGWYEWEITDLVTEWAAGTVTNHGMQIIGDEGPERARERVFYSREITAAGSPRLVIDYTVTPPPIVTVEPLPEWVTAAFTVSWSVVTPGPHPIAHYDVQFRVDGGDWIDWIEAATFTEAEFVGVHARTYDFRARGVDTADITQLFGPAQASTTVDDLPPVSSINPLPAVITQTTFLVSWSGEDEHSGIANYDVNYRFAGGAWTPWLLSTTLEQALFDAVAVVGPEVDGLYEFEVRATDNAGNVEAFTGEPEAAVILDIEPPHVVPRLWLPVIVYNATSSE